MSQYLTNKVETIVDAGTSLASAVETKEIKLDNFQTVKIVISTGEGDATTTKATLVAIRPDATEQEVKSYDIIIGAETVTEINVVANEIAHFDATAIKLVLDAVADTTITCGAVAVLGEPRYAVETETTEETE